MNKKKLLFSILILSLPAIAEMALNTLLGFTDTIMISRLIGPNALAGVGFANQIVFTLIFIFSSFNTGGTAIISRNFGEKKYNDMNKVAGEIITINLIIGIVITILALLFSKNIFAIYDMTQEVEKMTIDYFKIVTFGMPLMFLSFSFTTILRGSGDTRTPMIITGIVNITNIIGNYVLITGWGPFPALGVKGTAIATTISRLIATLLYIKVLFFNSNITKITLKDLIPTKKNIPPLWRLSFPGAIEQASMQLSFVALGVIISILDTTSEAAFRILINIESISFMPAVGLSIASATLVGKALGEKDKIKAKLTGYISSFLAISWGITIGIMFLLIPDKLIGIFTTEPLLIKASLTGMILAGLNQPLLNYMIVQGGTLRGAGDTRSVMIITSFRLWLIFVPMSYVLISHYNFGVEACWIAEITSFLIFIPVIFKRFYSEKWLDIQIYENNSKKII
ncbi:MAG: MATE family efflux transporter [Bacillota bacterium]|nr:MATE family efflux transporter [Bacillota bacterium]